MTSPRSRGVPNWRQDLHRLVDSLGPDEGRALAVIGSRLHRDAHLYAGCHALSSDPAAWSERTVDELADALVGIFMEVVRRRNA